MSAGAAVPKVWIVLPAYDEEASLPRLLEAIRGAMEEAGLDYGVVVVDDGSRDDTRRIAEEAARRMPLTLEIHPVNLGLGATIRDGLLRAASLAAPEDAVVTMDADNSHDPRQIPEMLALLEAGRDVVIASRFRKGSRVVGVPLLRRLLSSWGGWVFRLLLPIPGVRDYTCGYRAYRARVWQEVAAGPGSGFFDQEGFQAMVDILLKLRRSGLSFGEVPMVLRYDLKEGESKMKVGRTITRTLALVARRRFGGG